MSSFDHLQCHFRFTLLRVVPLQSFIIEDTVPTVPYIVVHNCRPSDLVPSIENLGLQWNWSKSIVYTFFGSSTYQRKKETEIGREKERRG